MGLFPESISKLAAYLAPVRQEGEDVEVRRVVTDSRATFAPGDLFVALQGERFDGAKFAAEAFAKGASAVIVASESRALVGELPPGKALLVVEDPLRALQLLAAEARRRWSGRVVAITGSNGKTTVKEMLRAVLGDSLVVSASPMSWNSQVGVALTLLALDDAAEVALIECGISEVGEMQRLAAMVQPDLGIFVNVGEAHRATLGDAETTAREKATLFARVGEAVPVLVPTAEGLATEALERVGAKVLRVGESGEFPMTWDASGTGLVVGPHTIAAPPVPVGLRMDFELAVSCALTLGVLPPSVERGAAGWAPAPMRLEMTMTPQGIFVINDAYSADVQSFDAALRTLTAVSGEGRSIAVVGPLAQLGRAQASAHQRVGEAVARARVSTLIVVSEGAGDIADAAIAAGMRDEHVLRVADVAEAALRLSSTLRRGDRVLVKASRAERLERVLEMVFTAYGPALAWIDLTAIADNFDALRRALGPDVAVMPVVKSFGYGLDSVRLSRLFVERGAEALCVAYADEGILLRERGLSVPIVVQNALPHELDKIVLHGLSAEAVDEASVRALAQSARRLRRACAVHIKVDTGMGRSGQLPAEALQTVRAALEEEGVVIEGLMTHLASADEPGADDFTQAQIERFSRFVDEARALGAAPRWVHCANTAGAVDFPGARFNMVRSGIGLLGYASLAGASPFRPTLRLTTRVVTEKWMEGGQSVGYGATWAVPEGDRRHIAVVAIGYNDGYPRHLSNCGWMSIRGVRCPVVGRVCMDVTMLDVSALSGAVHAGDEVVVYGTLPGEPTLPEMAQLAGTISYELLTRISSRVRRIFVGEISGQTAAT